MNCEVLTRNSPWFPFDAEFCESPFRHRSVDENLDLLARMRGGEFADGSHVLRAKIDMASPNMNLRDPVLYRTPSYDRAELHPLPPDSIHAYEMIWGSGCYSNPGSVSYKAGFIGTPSGPRGYRHRVAEYAARVGIGICADVPPYTRFEHGNIMSECEIIICPRGWGEQSLRHWDAWLSGKPVLTDKDCDSVEMIPGQRLIAGVHYLVYDEPEQIPDLVRHWTAPSRRDQLMEIAHNGRKAAQSYDGFARIKAFFDSLAAPRVVG